ncbi:programmed cell death protein 6 [Apiospora arundinis]
MAYNRPYNPDELPRFAEPDDGNGPRPAPQSSSASKYNSKPPPPLPTQQHAAPSSYHRNSDPHRLNPSPHPGQSNYGGRNYGGNSPVSSVMSPPPMASGPRPTAHNRPPASSRPPPSPVPSDGADPTLLPLFRAVDKDGTGQLSERELSAALVNGDWTAFDLHTVRMMIRMFDSDRSGTIGFDEFCGLWSFLASWRTLFDRFDADRSGNISLDEFSNALVAFRYRLSPPLRRAALLHLRQAQRRGHELRPLRPGLHQPQAHDRCLQEVRRGPRRLHHAQLRGLPHRDPEADEMRKCRVSSI